MRPQSHSALAVEENSTFLELMETVLVDIKVPCSISMDFKKSALEIVSLSGVSLY